LYFSVHRYDGGDFYPGTGDLLEVGTGKGKGFTVNVPLPPKGGADEKISKLLTFGDADYISIFTHIFMPIAYEFNPDLVIVSAGFDAVKGDPLGRRMQVTPALYGHLTAMLKSLAGGKLVMALEGGYGLDTTPLCVKECLKVLHGEKPSPLSPKNTSFATFTIIKKVMEVQSKYWKCFKNFVEAFGGIKDETAEQIKEEVTEGKAQPISQHIHRHNSHPNSQHIPQHNPQHNQHIPRHNPQHNPQMHQMQNMTMGQQMNMGMIPSNYIPNVQMMPFMVPPMIHQIPSQKMSQSKDRLDEYRDMHGDF
jgi:hypothetical protein